MTPPCHNIEEYTGLTVDVVDVVSVKVFVGVVTTVEVT